MLVVTVRPSADINVRMAPLSDFAEHEKLEKVLITFGAELMRGLRIGPDGRPILNLGTPDGGESAL